LEPSEISTKKRLDSTIAQEKDKRVESTWLNGLGVVYHSLGQTNLAIKYIERALVIAREMKDRREESLCLSNLGDCYGYLESVRCHTIDCFYSKLPKKDIDFFDVFLYITKYTF